MKKYIKLIDNCVITGLDGKPNTCLRGDTFLVTDQNSEFLRFVNEDLKPKTYITFNDVETGRPYIWKIANAQLFESVFGEELSSIAKLDLREEAVDLTKNSDEMIYKGEKYSIKKIADTLSAILISQGVYQISYDDLMIGLSKTMEITDFVSDEGFVDAVIKAMNNEIEVICLEDKKSEMNIEEMLGFLTNCGYDVIVYMFEQKVCDQINAYINENVVEGRKFKFKDQSTWISEEKGQIQQYLNGIQKILEDNNVFLTKKLENEMEKEKDEYIKKVDDKKITDKKIYDLVYEKLDETTILLLKGIITGNWEFKFDPDYRYIVYNHLKNNKKGKAAQVVLSSFFKNEVKIETPKQFIVEYKATKSPTILRRDKNANIIAISKIGDTISSFIFESLWIPEENKDGIVSESCEGKGFNAYKLKNGYLVLECGEKFFKKDLKEVDLNSLFETLSGCDEAELQPKITELGFECIDGINEEEIENNKKISKQRLNTLSTAIDDAVSMAKLLKKKVATDIRSEWMSKFKVIQKFSKEFTEEEVVNGLKELHGNDKYGELYKDILKVGIYGYKDLKESKLNESPMGDFDYTSIEQDPIKRYKAGDVIENFDVAIKLLFVSNKLCVGRLEESPKYYVYSESSNYSKAMDSWKFILDVNNKYDNYLKGGKKFPTLVVGENITIKDKDFKVIYFNEKKSKGGGWLYYYATNGDDIYNIELNEFLSYYVNSEEKDGEYKNYKYNKVSSAYHLEGIPELKSWYDKLVFRESEKGKKEKKKSEKELAKFDFSKYLPKENLYIVYAHSGRYNGSAIIGAESVADAKKRAKNSSWLDLGVVDSAESFEKYYKEMGEKDSIELEMISFAKQKMLPSKLGEWFEIEWGF